MILLVFHDPAVHSNTWSHPKVELSYYGSLETSKYTQQIVKNIAVRWVQACLRNMLKSKQTIYTLTPFLLTHECVHTSPSLQCNL